MILVNPNNRNPLPLAAAEPPLWLSLMAAHLLGDGKDVTILDAEAEGLSPEDTVRRIESQNAVDIILVVMGNNPSVSSTPKMPIAEKLLEMLDRDKVWLAGLHPMAVQHEKVWNWRPTKCLPLPWHLLPMHLYRAHNWHCLDGSLRQPYASIYTSLGCPFDCYFCNIHSLYQSRSLIYRGIPSIIQEVDMLVNKHQVRNIKIWDELFALSPERVLPICTQLRNYDLNMWAYARVDTITQPMLEAIKEAGVNWLAYGFETTSKEVRLQSKKYFTGRKVEEAIKMTRKAGINIIANFMFGLPGETEQTALDTLQWAKDNLFEFANFYVALPYPGSEWYEDTKYNRSWEDFNQCRPLRDSDEAMFLFKEKAFREYFNNPAYLEMIKSKFGTQGVNQIKEMLSYSIGGQDAVK